MLNLAPRWRKVFRDLIGKENKALLAILAIALGVFAFGTVTNAYSILLREINVNYQNTAPESAIISVEDATPELLRKIQDLPSVSVASARKVVTAHTLVQRPTEEIGSWQATRFFVIDNFEYFSVAKISSESGAWPPSFNGFLMERSSASLANFQEGQAVTFKTASGTKASLRFEGVGFDAARAPGWQDGVNYIYITPQTLKHFGLQPTLNEVLIQVANPEATVSDIKVISKEVEALILAEGQKVSGIIIRPPGVHPHSDQMNSLLLLFQVFSLLTLVLAAILTATTLNAILGKQAMVLIMSSVALAISMVPAVWVARAFATFLAELLNFNITSNAIPFNIYAIQILTAFAMPLIATLLPIIKSTGITVKDALNNYGINTNSKQTTGQQANTLLANIPFNRPLLMSLRNTFRKRIRLVLTIGILALAGASFSFSETYPNDIVQQSLSSVDNIENFESWGQAEATNIEKGSFDGLRFRINAVPENTNMINFPILKGNWLSSESENIDVKEIMNSNTNIL